MRFFVGTIVVFLLSATLVQAAEGDEELRQFGVRSVGTWNSTVTDNGRTVRVTTTTKWGAGRRSLLIEQRTVPAIPAHEHTSIVGWHPLEKRLVLLQFHSDGSGTVAKVTRLGRDGAKWLGEVVGVTSQGESASMTLTQTFLGSRAFKLELSDIKVSGKAMKAPPALVFEKQ